MPTTIDTSRPFTQRQFGMLEDLRAALPGRKNTSIGYPIATDFDASDITPLLGYMLNNAGDPYVDAIYQQQTRPFEREVVDFFAELYNAPADDYWGYVTSGGTEGNLYGMYLGRERFPGAHIYYSSASHYSIPKNAYLLGLPQHKIPALPNGEIDYHLFKDELRQHADAPAIVVANIGTTMAEAKDNIARLRTVAAEVGVTSLHMHSDAALCGGFIGLLDTHYAYDFSDGADSIAVSGHKFIGSPFPCGVVVTRGSYKDIIAGSPMYVGSPDTTIGGSRSGIAAVSLWSSLARHDRDGLRHRALSGLELADYVHTEIKQRGHRAWRNPDALTVVFETPSRDIVRKWQLATYDGWSHVICMPGVTKEQIDGLLDDLAA